MKLPDHQHLYVRSMGKSLRVTAMFKDDDDANRYMARNRDEGVVAVMAGVVLLANLYDKGSPQAKVRATP